MQCKVVIVFFQERKGQKYRKTCVYVCVCQYDININSTLHSMPLTDSHRFKYFLLKPHH